MNGLFQQWSLAPGWHPPISRCLGFIEFLQLFIFIFMKCFLFHFLFQVMIDLITMNFIAPPPMVGAKFWGTCDIKLDGNHCIVKDENALCVGFLLYQANWDEYDTSYLIFWYGNDIIFSFLFNSCACWNSIWSLTWILRMAFGNISCISWLFVFYLVKLTFWIFCLLLISLLETLSL